MRTSVRNSERPPRNGLYETHSPNRSASCFHTSSLKTPSIFGGSEVRRILNSLRSCAYKGGSTHSRRRKRTTCLYIVRLLRVLFRVCSSAAFCHPALAV